MRQTRHVRNLRTSGVAPKSQHVGVKPVGLLYFVERNSHSMMVQFENADSHRDASLLCEPSLKNRVRKVFELSHVYFRHGD